MDFFEKVGSVISTRGKEVAQKAKDTSDLVKLRTEVGQLEGKIKTWYQVIGEKVYQNEKDQDHSGLEVEFGMITEAFAEIGRLKKQIAELRGKQECPVCKAEVSGDSAFCPKCGARMEEEEVCTECEETETAETIVEEAAETESTESETADEETAE